MRLLKHTLSVPSLLMLFLFCACGGQVPLTPPGDSSDPAEDGSDGPRDSVHSTPTYAHDKDGEEDGSDGPRGRTDNTRTDAHDKDGEHETEPTNPEPVVESNPVGDGSELGSYSVLNRLDRHGHENKFDPTLDEFREYLTFLPHLARTQSIQFCLVIENLDPDKGKTSEEIRETLKPLLAEAVSTWNQLLQKKPNIGNIEFPDWPAKNIPVAFGCNGEDVLRVIVDPTHWKIKNGNYGTVVFPGKSPDGEFELLYHPNLFSMSPYIIHFVVLHEYGHLFGIGEHYFQAVFDKGNAFGIMAYGGGPSVHDRVAIWNIWRYTKNGGKICPTEYYEREYGYVQINCVSKAFLANNP